MKKVICILATAGYLIPYICTGQAPELYAQEKGAVSQGTSDSSDKTEETPEEPVDYSRPIQVYDSEGRRDPFKSLLPKKIDTEKKLKSLLNYEGAKLNGIVRNKDDVYALVVDENSFGYVLREGYRVFGGYVIKITDDAIHLHIVKYGRSLSIIMRLESSKSAVYVEKEQNEFVIQKPGINVTYKKEDQTVPVVLIEEVNVPSLDIKTVEEEWFGSKSTIPLPARQETEVDEEIPAGSFSIVDPSDNSWIKIPYVLDWTKMEGENIHYTLYIDDDSDFSSPLFVKNNLMSSSFLLGENVMLPPNRNLFWKIIAQDVSGNRAVCRQTDMSFKIIGK